MAAGSIDLVSLNPWEEQDQEWLSDPQLPISDVGEMVAYMRKAPHMSWALQTMVINDQEMPQSYAHWWCMSRQAYPAKIFEYPTLQKWVDTQREWWDNVSEKGGVIAMFQSWLDLVRFDLCIFDDDDFRKGIPRLTRGGTIVIPKEDSEFDHGPTREDTVRFIVDEGHAIFSERGWTKGREYWHTYTKHL